MSEAETKVLALALYEMRLMLARYLGSDTKAAHEIRLTAHLAYALHNDALAAIRGEEFDFAAALIRIAEIDRVIGGDEGQRISNKMKQMITERRTEYFG